MLSKQKFSVKLDCNANPKQYSYQEIKCIPGFFRIISSNDSIDNCLFISDGEGNVTYVAMNHDSDIGHAGPWKNDMFVELKNCKVEIDIK